MTIGEFVDDILRDIKQKPDDRIPSEKRIAQKFELLLRIVQYYSSLMEDSPAQAALLRQALEDSGFKLPGEAEMKARRPNGNGLSAHP
jgi:L-lysine 2,3-aminomutase